MPTVPTITTRDELSTRAQLFQTAADTYSSFPPPVAADFRQLVSHTQAWIEITYVDGSTALVPVKFAAYRVDPSQYSQHRRRLDSAKAVAVITKWASEVPVSDPAFQRVRDFCAVRDLVCRTQFRVLRVPGTFSLPSSSKAAPSPVGEEAKDRLLADFFIGALPTLCAAERARVVTFAATLI